MSDQVASVRVRWTVVLTGRALWEPTALTCPQLNKSSFPALTTAVNVQQATGRTTTSVSVSGNVLVTTHLLDN